MKIDKCIKILVTAFIGVVIISVVSSVRGETAARKKAKYYYTAGTIERALDNDDRAYEYFKKAYNADPTYEEAAAQYGVGRLSNLTDTLQTDTEIKKSLSLIRKLVDKYPGEVYESQYYAYLAGNLDMQDEAIEVLERAYKLNPGNTTTLMYLYEVYASKGDYKEAAEWIDKYEKAEGINPRLMTIKLSALLSAGDSIGALREADRLIDSDPANPSYMIIKGNLYDVMEKQDSALICYLRAEEIDPEAGEPKLALAGYYSETGDSVAYDTKMYDVLLCEDVQLDTKIELLAQYLQTLITDSQETQRGDYLFSVLQEQYPHEPEVLDLAARYSAAKKDYKDAIEQISYAIDRDPSNITYWGQLMTYQSADGHPEQSIETYQKAKSQIKPDDTLRLYYTITAQTAKRYDLAEESYREMIDEIQNGLQIDSVLTLNDLRRDITLDELDRLSGLLTSLGDLYHVDNQNERAFKMYENALVLNPDNATASNNYAYFLSLDGGDLDKALDLSRQSLSGDNAGNATFLDTFAWINYLKGDYATALEIQNKAVLANDAEKYPSAEIYEHMGDIYDKLGKIDRAIEYWEKGIKVREDNEETDEPEYHSVKEKILEAKKKQ